MLCEHAHILLPPINGYLTAGALNIIMSVKAFQNIIAKSAFGSISHRIYA